MAKSVDDIKALRRAYARLFETDDGKLVLEDLAKRFYHNAMDADDLYREAGRRDVIYFINQQVRQHAQ